jgi:hypothetical protein
MKTIITVTALLIAITSHSQVSINAGLIPTLSLKAAVEKQTVWNNTEASAMVSMGNYRPVYGIQSGVSFENSRGENFRFLAGGFYHTGYIDPKTEMPCSKIKLGGSFRWLFRSNTSFAVAYNGQTMSIGFGYLFKRRS